ncbi:MAG TPA: hypothetical protein VKB70_05280 [Gaiellaceae bacterium]|nr:hypothetical protein [Gaiellaceae bacterium]
MDAHAKPGLGEAHCGGAAGDPAADDGDVDAAVIAAVLARRNGIFEPVRVQDVER